MVTYLGKDFLQIQTKIMTFFAFILFFNLAFTQDLQEFDYKINDSIKGHIKANGEIYNDTIFDGDFQFFTSFTNTNPFIPKTSLTYRGNYNKNVKSGTWTLSHKSFKALDKFIEEDYQLNLNTSGKEIYISAYFEEGLANEDWSATGRLFENSKIKDTIYTVDAIFKDSKMIESLKANFPDSQIQLNFNEDGFADGEWTFSHDLDGKNVEDIIIFEDGIYKSRKLVIEGKTTIIEQFGLDKYIEKPTTIKYNEGMSRVLDLMNFNPISKDISNDLFQKINNKSLSYLDKAASIFITHDGVDIWQNFKGSEELKIGLFKIKKYPLSAIEKSKIAEIGQNIKQINQKIDYTLKNSFLEIGKLNYEELNIQESILTIYKNYAAQIVSIQDKLNTKEIEYINYKAILPEWLPEQDFPDKISYRFQGKEFTISHEFPEPIKKSNIDISSILNLVNKIYDNILVSNKKTSQIFNQMTKKEALSDREQEFVDLKKKLIALYENTENKSSYNDYHETVSSNFIRIVNDRITSFSNLNIDEKEKQIDEYIDCYKSLENAYKKIENIPIRLNRLDELYSLTTFNPYVMANMTERLKSRIYNAFEDYLMPNILDKLNTTQTCNQVEKTLQLFDNIYERMVALIDEDTKDIEKLLKREKDPQTIMGILNINPS